jgi:hypothetical protein
MYYGNWALEAGHGHHESGMRTVRVPHQAGAEKEQEAVMLLSMKGDPESVVLELKGPEVWLVRLGLKTFRDNRPYHYDHLDEETDVLDGILARLPSGEDGASF